MNAQIFALLALVAGYAWSDWFDTKVRPRLPATYGPKHKMQPFSPNTLQMLLLEDLVPLLLAGIVLPTLQFGALSACVLATRLCVASRTVRRWAPTLRELPRVCIGAMLVSIIGVGIGMPEKYTLILGLALFFILAIFVDVVLPRFRDQHRANGTH